MPKMQDISKLWYRCGGPKRAGLGNFLPVTCNHLHMDFNREAKAALSGSS